MIWDSERAEDIVERITDAFVALDREWRYVYVNGAAERLGGRSRAELLGRVIWEVRPDLVGTEIERRYRRAFDEQLVERFETHYPPLDVWVEASIYPSPSGVSVYVRDISARKKAEIALAASEERYRLIVDTAHEGIWLVDADYRTRFANARAAEMFGTTPAEMLGRAVHEFVDERDLPGLRERIGERKQRISNAYDIRMKGAGGRTIWCLVRVSPVLSADGSFDGALGMITDITERKEYEAELARQREWLAVTLASVGDAVIATDAEGLVTFMNPVAEQLTGWEGAAAAGRPLAEVFRIVNEQTREPVENPVSKVLREDRVVGLANHTALIARDGTERPIDDSGAPIRSPDGKIVGVVLVFRDNTERALTERNLRDADRRKDEFLAMLAHELRNPLAPIRSALDLMRLAVDNRATVARARTILDRQVQHMTQLVDDLLDVSRITRGKIKLRHEHVDLATVVARAVETVMPSVEGRRQTLDVSQAEEPLELDADPTRLSQVLSNLLHNASKFTPEGGTIALTTAREGSSVVVRVRDDGIGIPRDALQRVFEPFLQLDPSVDRAQGGLGIGLTLVKSLVDMHGGDVVAASDGPGLGTEVVVRLPLRPSSAVKREIADRGAPDSLRVLVVDDNADAAEMLSELLACLGHASSIAYDGVAALERIAADVPQVMLIDIGLPGMNGLDLARRIRREHGHEITLVAVSGYAQDEDRSRSREAGFDGHFAKPVDIERLQAFLAEATQARRSQRDG